MKDDWISTALSDDTVVADLLFQLKHHHPTHTPAMGLSGWGSHKPRSKPSSNTSVKKAYITTTRCSPTTPLSWSGGTASPSDGASDLSSAFRSKGTFTHETSNISSSSSKRSKNKRTFTELKEKENLLLNERVHLERELASTHVNLNEQRARSDNLKRIKIDLNLQSSNDMAAAESVSNRCSNLLEPSRTDHADSVLSRHTMDDDLASSENQNRGFFLPDLNVMPSEDEIGTLWN
ncbi:uncharacterized protein LOC132614248 isoform X2 [Lycium barbarum]|uniref:uncharacterized protein LOC132614248 isoform X2 n=1 Tax=Lycium barbarum TaxID=112863 RepID=UPI00293E2387|nr:uncharacterized protein LOC132614248 isoform X2 [Lycium barbarum]